MTKIIGKKTLGSDPIANVYGVATTPRTSPHLYRGAVWRINGEERWVLIHTEIQGQRETKFAERMFIYNYRLRDRYNQLFFSLAVLTDEESNWRPNKFSSDELWGTQLSFQFATVKLLDYGQDWAALENNQNPFAKDGLQLLPEISQISDLVLLHLSSWACSRGILWMNCVLSIKVVVRKNSDRP